MSSTFDTLVVGAGPTGLTLAAELLRQGIPASQILLIDVLKEPLIQTKASVLWPRSLELLSNYEGVVEMGEAYGDKLTNVVLRAGKDNTLIAKINLARHFDSTFHHGLMLEQWYTEKIITAYLSKHGLSVTRSTALVSFVYTDHPLHPIEATLKTPNGNKTIRVKYIVGADGGRSGVRKQLGIEFKGETMQGTFFSAHFSVKKPLLDIDNTALSLFLRPSGMGFITPMPGGTYMSALDLQGQQCGPFLSNEKDARGFPLLKEIPLKEAEVILRERLSLHIEVDKMIWQTHFRIQERLVGKYGDGKRVFLAGDACHAHSPLGGQGQNTGIQDAVNLGWKLSSVLKGTLSPSLLATYEEERLAVGQHLIDFTMRGTKASSIRNPIFSYLRDNFLSLATSQEFVRTIMGQTISETIHHYRACNINAENWTKPSIVPNLWQRRGQNILRMLSTRVQAGDRVHNHMLPSVEDAFWTTTAGFKLLLFEGRKCARLSTDLTAAELQELGEELMKQTLGVVSAAVVVPEALNESSAFGVYGQAVFLVRPDGYVGLRCEPVNADQIKAYLRDRVGLLKFEKSALSFTVQKFRPVKHDWVHGVFLVAAVGAGYAFRHWYLSK